MTRCTLRTSASQSMSAHDFGGAITRYRRSVGVIALLTTAINLKRGVLLDVPARWYFSLYVVGNEH